MGSTVPASTVPASTVPVSTWALGIAAAGIRACPEGQRNAEEDECLAVLREVIGAAKVVGFKVVDDGDGSGVPHGCSYSRKSSNALFNRNVGGASLDTMYPLACRSVPVSTLPVNTVPASTWALGVAAAGIRTRPEAVGVAKVVGFKVVDDGDGLGVPHGCSYSRKSSNALYNSNTAAGATLNTMYPLVCTARV